MRAVGSAKGKVGRPRNPVPPARPALWEKPAVARRLDDILVALELPAIQTEARLYLQRMLFRSECFAKHFGHHDGGAGQVTLLIRTILESEGNQDALVEPIVSAVWGAMRPEWTQRGLAWIEAFDRIPLMQILQTMRGLDLFSEKSIGHYFSIALRNKLWAIFGPDVAKPAPVRAAKSAKRKEQPKRRPADQPARRMAA